MAVGALTSGICGFIVAIHYKEHQSSFYNDEWHFDITTAYTDDNVEYMITTGNDDYKSSARFQGPESEERFNTEERED